MVRNCVLAGLCLLWGCSDGNDPPTVEMPPEGEEREDAAVSRLDASPGSPGSDAASDASRALDARAPVVQDAAAVVDAAASADAGERTDANTPPASACKVGPVPASVRSELQLDPFYKKYADANGLAVLGSDKPADRSLQSACELVISMVARRDDVRKALIAQKARFAIIGANEGTAEIPEYGYRERSQADRDQINQRARGLGGQVASCGEENILCLQGDRYWNESICVHEFAHTISTYGVFRADRTFEQRLNASYTAARDEGILDRSYRKENVQEYWAEGVQDWYDTNATSDPPNGIHNTVNTRVELKSYDATLYGLVEQVFPPTLAWEDCHAP